MDEEAEIKTKKKFTWGLFITGACLFIIGLWFETSSIHYTSPQTIIPYCTSGWFILGFVFIAMIACGFSLIFCLVAKKITWLAWLLMLTVSSSFIIYSINSSLPRKRLSVIVGPEAAEKVQIKEFHISDSFNAGIFAYGVIAYDDNLIALIKKHRPLKMKISFPMNGSDILKRFKRHKFPEIADIYSDDHGSFYVSNKGKEVYFTWRSFLPVISKRR